MATAGPSSQPDVPGRALAEKNLLDHVNKIRQTPTFVGLEQVLRMTGDDWIESMIEQAKDIRSKWAAQFEANSAHQQATMAGEMLKTPSRKKATARQRAASSKLNLAKSRSANPFGASDIEEEDKENAPGAARGTRSKADKSAIAKLPNPFQAKLAAVAAKGKAVDHPVDTEEGVEGVGVPAHEGVEEEDEAAPAEATTKTTKGKPKKAPAKKAAKAPAKKTAAGKGKKKKEEDKKEDEMEEVAQPSKAQEPMAPAAKADEAVVPASEPPHSNAADDSMEVESTLEKLDVARPTASTPTGKKIGSARRNRLRLSDDTLAPIADAIESEEDDEQSHDDEDAGRAEKADSAAEATVALTTAPRQKRTLASFGGAKMSMAHAAQTPIAAKTPASSGFKSSFLTKSLRQASIRKTDDDGVAAEDSDDSVIDTGSLKANTEANAAAMVGTKTSVASQTRSSPRLSASKRKSDEVDEIDVVAQKAAKTESGKSTAATAQHSSATGAKQGPSANLLRSKLESARLQRSVNPGTVGLGAKNITSPILGQGSAPSSPEPAAKGRFGSGMAPSSSNVSQLRDRFEASLRSPPPKSTGILDAKKSPSRLPLPISMQSTTPQHSPTKKQNPAPPAAAPVPKTKPAQPAPLPPAAPVVDRPEEISGSSAGSAVTASSEVKEKARSREGSRASEESTRMEDDGDAGDDEREEDGAVTTKVTRPLSGGQASKSAESTTTSLKDALEGDDDSDGDSSLGVELTLEDLEGKKAAATLPASATATQALSKGKGPAALPSAAQPSQSGPLAARHDSTAHAGGPGWSSRLKGLFVGITGAPNGHAAGPPPPGTGFQPNKLNRSVSGAPGKDDSTVVRSNFASSQGVGGTSAKPASVVRAEQLRRKEAEDAERRSKEREDKRKQIAAAKAIPSAKADVGEKRVRDDDDTQARSTASTARLNQNGAPNGQPKARVMSQFANSTAAVTRPPAPKATNSSEDVNGKKRRLSQERDEETKARPPIVPSVPSSVSKPSTAASGNRLAPGTTTASKFAVPKTVRPGQPQGNGTIRPASALKTAPNGQQAARPASTKPGMISSTSTNNFSQQNPFQASSARPGPAPSAQRPAQHQVSAQASARKEAAAAAAAAAAASNATPAFAAYGTTGTVAPNLEDDNLSLPSIASEYSDSEDEETQARRARAAPWTKGDALQSALQAQSQMDADLIFGVPTGNVDLETLMPPQDHAGRMRMNRPRSSSANWSGTDGLAQWEIDRYNQRMNIGGPGFRLPARATSASAVGGSATLDQRRSVVATIGAAAAARQQQQQQQQGR
ncbi:hypothetical protein BDZ90DRAFT_7014 [Jaminaea rosea]|uniref:Inner centromere protein ARK-binding domain-containing protein n=1 Tax=Jaminaea rosea TaxID=1569628 RepID=A0A316UY13_9BASI|nr:hypothetical protein BDZ90DRAFT_7014 [Jaminaea rosea]PWN30207.1 hypothetical protein BDZ90DRAFT_7014 [Jaminaea rosea]